MHKYLIPGVAALALLVPFAASAHEHGTYQINGAKYDLTIGSLNEPVAVDDKTGVDLTVTKGGGAPTKGPDGDLDGPPAGSVPVTGLDQTLKVELVAGGQKKTLDLVPVDGEPGHYTATFYPTVATTIAYHLVGSIDGHAVDLSFTCLPPGSPEAADVTAPVDLGNGVTQTALAGGFDCPVAKEDLGFPAPSAPVAGAAAEATGAKHEAQIALALAAAALALSLGALFRGRRK